MDLETLLARLAQVQQSPEETIDEQFYSLMLSAEEVLGEQSYQMADFYFEYGKFILNRMENNFDEANKEVQQEPGNQEQEVAQIQNVLSPSEGIQPAQNTAEEQPQQAETERNKNQSQKVTKQQEIQAQNQQSENFYLPDDQQQKQEKQRGEQQSDEESKTEDESNNQQQICLQNLTKAVQLLEKQLHRVKEGVSENTLSGVLNKLRRARARLGDFYLMTQRYPQCIEEYNRAIAHQKERGECQSSRLVAELHYLAGNAVLYQHHEGCELLAMNEYCTAIHILVNHLNHDLSYDTSGIQVPCVQNFAIDRLGFMPRTGDDENVRQIKDTLSCLLDKLEDTHHQISVIKKAVDKHLKNMEIKRQSDRLNPIKCLENQIDKDASNRKISQLIEGKPMPLIEVKNREVEVKNREVEVDADSTERKHEVVESKQLTTDKKNSGQMGVQMEGSQGQLVVQK